MAGTGKLVDLAGDAVRGAIRAYHGSPARGIRQFDPKRIGSSGNGTAIGYGFNFSEDPGFARQYTPFTGKTYEVEIGYPEDSLLRLDESPAGQHLDAISDMIARAPVNSWQGEAIADLARGKSAHTVLESLLRSYNTADMGRSKNMARIASELFDRQIPGGVTQTYGPKAYVMYPGTEDSISILRKYGLLPATLGAEGLVNQQQPGE
jgi:hypothetical protein